MSKFMTPLKLCELFDVEVHGSYWTLLRRGRINLIAASHIPIGSHSRAFQKAQLIQVKPMWQGDGDMLPITFINLHLPSSGTKKLTLEWRKKHIKEATRWAGVNGIIMGDLNILGQDRPQPKAMQVIRKSLMASSLERR